MTSLPAHTNKPSTSQAGPDPVVAVVESADADDFAAQGAAAWVSR